MNLKENPFYLTQDEEKQVFNTLNTLTEVEKIGQLFCIMGQDYTDEQMKHLVQDYAIGAVLYRPTYTISQLKSKFAQLDQWAKIPLLKSANLEEGASGAVTDGIRFSSQLGVSAADNDADTEHFAYACAQQARKAGINWTYSPVADLCINPLNPIISTRSFGSCTETVMKNTEIAVSILQRNGIAAAVKHFPGDGIDYRDQHLHPTVNSMSEGKWWSTTGKIYQNLIDKGLLSIMAGHILLPSVQKAMNPQLRCSDLMPCSLSKELLQVVLRGKMGFNGLIISDATIMDGFCMAMPRRQAIPSAINAGCDMLCFTAGIEDDIQVLKDSVKDGTLSHERLDEAVTRILALKAVVERRYEKDTTTCLSDWQKKCADHAVTLIKNKRGILPLKKEKYNSVRLVSFGDMETVEGNLLEHIKLGIKQEGLHVEDYDPLQDEFEGALHEYDDILTIYIANEEPSSNNTSDRLFWCKKHALDSPRYCAERDYIFISFANPFHLQDVPRIPVYINAWTATMASADAVLSKLFGHSEFQGIDPVDSFCGLFDTRL